jgi:cysteine synthase A
MKIGKSIADIIGNTPIIQLSKLIPPDLKAEIWAKCEFANPTGSVKDRPAIYMIRKAEREGKIQPGKTLVLASTGNFATGMTGLASALGYKTLIVMPGGLSQVVQKHIQFLGGEVRTTPGRGGATQSSLDFSFEIAEKDPEKYHFFNQWNDEANVDAHYESTGKEILDQLSNRVDAFVAGIGSGGTLVGVGKRLKRNNPKTKVVGMEPAECPFIFEGKLGDHKIEGIGDGIVPGIVKRHRNMIDDYVLVKSDDAIKMSRRIGREMGIPVGISSGANVVAAIEVAKRFELGEGQRVVTILPDYALRYLSTELFKNI